MNEEENELTVSIAVDKKELWIHWGTYPQLLDRVGLLVRLGECTHPCLVFGKCCICDQRPHRCRICAYER